MFELGTPHHNGDSVPRDLETARDTRLAGYLIVPGTFTALQKSGQVQDALAKDDVGQAIPNTVQNPPLLAIACILFVASTAALGWLDGE
ncbi:hypothetical protein BJX66DRAFT_315038 [Aspergillus keveii]|uniref:Uncharacterized protein n=1 Tax=Aspergillus keveii TaxID=714993 RepID=A0ABR4FQ23_9EURO